MTFQQWWLETQGPVPGCDLNAARDRYEAAQAVWDACWVIATERVLSGERARFAAHRNLPTTWEWEEVEEIKEAARQAERALWVAACRRHGATVVEQVVLAEIAAAEAEEDETR